MSTFVINKQAPIRELFLSTTMLSMIANLAHGCNLATGFSIIWWGHPSYCEFITVGPWEQGAAGTSVDTPDCSNSVLYPAMSRSKAAAKSAPLWALWATSDVSSSSPTSHPASGFTSLFFQWISEKKENIWINLDACIGKTMILKLHKKHSQKWAD